MAQSPLLAQLPDGRPVLCLVCGWNQFVTREVKLNTTGAEMFGLAWANAAALALICTRCTFIHEFTADVLQYFTPPQ